MRYIINELINNVCQKVNIIGNGQSADGNTAKAALNDLNDVITELNLNEYLAFNYKSYDVSSNNATIRIGDNEEYECVLEEAPLTVTSVSRKVGNHWQPLTKVSKTTLDRANTTDALPTCYAYETEYDIANDCLVSKILLNSSNKAPLRVLLLRAMPLYKINDTINLPQPYINLIESALCVKTCERYKLEYVQIYKDELNALKESIERINNSNRPITLDVGTSYGIDTNYYNGVNGTGW